MPKTLDKPNLGDLKIEGVNLNSLSDYAVKAFNNDITPFDDVMMLFLKDCGYDRNTALRYTNKIHEEGSAVCFWGNREQCERIVGCFKKIKVFAEIVNN